LTAALSRDTTDLFVIAGDTQRARVHYEPELVTTAILR
jgi:hypothetical protein